MMGRNGLGGVSVNRAFDDDHNDLVMARTKAVTTTKTMTEARSLHSEWG